MYKRPMIAKPEKEHPLQTEYAPYGLLSSRFDAGWIVPHLEGLMDDGRFVLHQFSKAIDNAKSLRLDDYKPEVVKERKAEILLDGKRRLLAPLKKYIEKYKSEVNAVANEILRISEPSKPSNPTEAMLLEMRHREIRDNLRNIPPKDRRAAVSGSLERLQALITNPDPFDIIVDPSALVEMRREYAFQQDPTLREKEVDQQRIYEDVRQRAGEISAISCKMLIDAKMDDPLPPSEFYETFTPQTDYERSLIASRIQKWERAKEEEKRKKKQAEKDDPDKRPVKINRGIQH